MSAIEKPPTIYVDEQDPSVTGLGWTIDTLETLDWALSRVADLESEISENEAVAARAHAAVDMKTAQLNARAMRGAAFFRQQIAAYAQAHREELLKGGKKKSRNLLHGVVGWRSSGGGLEVTDREALLAWAKNQPAELGLLRVKLEPDLVAIKAHAKAHNLIPPGMQEKPEAEELKIEAQPVALPAMKEKHQ